ncbi:MAG: glycosyltransferase family 4 protein [Nitrospirae bacterium]|nr:glycosyltransferase family 4 protein [Nitrospirota bacterium]
MKICQVSNTLPGYHEDWGGAEKECLNLASLLKEKGLEVCFLTTSVTGIRNEKVDVHEIPTVKDCHYPGSRFLSFLFSLVQFDLISFWYSYRTLKRCQPQVIHFHNMDRFSFSPLIAAKLLHIPVILTLVDYWCICPKRILVDKRGEVCHLFQGARCINCLGLKRIRDKVRIYLRKYVFNLFLRKADAFVCLSESSERIIQNYGIERRKVRTIYQPLGKGELLHSFKNVQREKLNLKYEGEGKKVLLFIGWVRFHKGLHVVIKALPEVVKKVPQVVLFVVENQPDEEYKRELKRFVKEKGLEQNVIMFEGKRSPAEIKHLYALAEIVVIPEQWENMSPVTLMEASLYNKPIVASRIGGIPEFIKDKENGLLAEPADPQDWARKLIYLLEHPDEAGALGEKACAHVQRLADGEQVFREMNALYMEMLAKRRGRK